MSRHYLRTSTTRVCFLFSVIALTACGGGGGGGGGNGAGTPPPAPTPALTPAPTPALTPAPTPGATPPPPGDTRLRIVWQNSYLYQHSGTDNRYWYAQVVYQNVGSQALTITCAGRTDPAVAKEHISETAEAGTFAATETFCSRNPDSTRVIDPGGVHYEWAIFNKVPEDGKVALEWESYGVAQGENPWEAAYPATMPHPAECPPGTCQSNVPEGRAANVIVLVHGCCTDAPHVDAWRALADAMVGEMLHSPPPGAWEIIVWDWHDSTPPPPPGLSDWGGLLTYADIAYKAAENEGPFLALAVEQYAYRYIHLIGHGAGANLIDVAANLLADSYKKQGGVRPFLHLTFLDAYTPTKEDSGEAGGKGYGYLEDYPQHYSEHYVDRTPSAVGTNACLASAFNFDLTDWHYNPYKGGGVDASTGHQWPRYWYEQSVTTPPSSQTSGFAFGYPLAFEGGDNTYTTLADDYPKNLQCRLSDLSTKCKPVKDDPTYQCWK
jgi:hypothetical protein